MSISFSRSTRALNQDSFRPGLVGLAVIMLVLIVWLGWFFLARVPLYETGRVVQVKRDGTLLVAFSPDVLARLSPGQTATVQLAGINLPFPAEVMSLPARGQSAVEVYVFSSVDAPYPPADVPVTNLTGEVKVEVDSVSPAQLALRTLGQAEGTRP
ncbi:MAG: hypothetical protein KA765_13000 [Thermoflexales bacterium]|nr:hypothetical protein [Thermoflexales bacterium]